MVSLYILRSTLFFQTVIHRSPVLFVTVTNTSRRHTAVKLRWNIQIGNNTLPQLWVPFLYEQNHSPVFSTIYVICQDCQGLIQLIHIQDLGYSHHFYLITSQDSVFDLPKLNGCNQHAWLTTKYPPTSNEQDLLLVVCGPLLYFHFSPNKQGPENLISGGKFLLLQRSRQLNSAELPLLSYATG